MWSLALLKRGLPYDRIKGKVRVIVNCDPVSVIKTHHVLSLGFYGKLPYILDGQRVQVPKFPPLGLYDWTSSNKSTI